MTVSTRGYLLRPEQLELMKRLEESKRTGGAMIANGIATTADTTQTPTANWSEPCQEGQSSGSEYDDPNWGKRDRSGAHVGERSKRIARERKAAKAARKAR